VLYHVAKSPARVSLMHSLTMLPRLGSNLWFSYIGFSSAETTGVQATILLLGWK
jgi:hypothetical protein